MTYHQSWRWAGHPGSPGWAGSLGALLAVLALLGSRGMCVNMVYRPVPTGRFSGDLQQNRWQNRWIISQNRPTLPPIIQKSADFPYQTCLICCWYTQTADRNRPTIAVGRLQIGLVSMGLNAQFNLDIIYMQTFCFFDCLPCTNLSVLYNSGTSLLVNPELLLV